MSDTSIALEQFGMTFRREPVPGNKRGEWVSYPTNIDGTCDFDEGTAVGVGEWEDSTPEEITMVLDRLDDIEQTRSPWKRTISSAPLTKPSF